MKSIPLGLSIILSIISAFASIIYDYQLDYKFYIGLVFLISAIFLYFIKKEVYFYVFGLLLLLCTLGVLDLYYHHYRAGIGSILINPIYLLLLIMFFWSNDEITSKLFPKKNSSVLTPNYSEKMINLYKEQYKLKTKDELEKISAIESGFVIEARMAAEQVLNERF